jgi:hypothetical protein
MRLPSNSLSIPLLLLALGACGGGETEGEGEAGAGTFISLDDAPLPLAGEGNVATSEASLTEGSARPVEAGSDDGPRALETWLRGMPEERSRLAAFSAGAAEALQDFGSLWDGGSRRYRAGLRQALEAGGADGPGALGADFASYAQAYAEGDRSGLGQALSTGAVGSIAWLAWTEAAVQLDLEADRFEEAGRGLARLIDGQIEAGFDRLRTASLAADVRLVGDHAAEFLPTRSYQVQPGDSYDRICRSFRKQGLHVYQGWVAEINGRSNYKLRAEETLLIPEAKLKLRAWRGARLAVFEADGIPVRLYEVSMGRKGEPTPLGDFTIDTCLKDPVWYREDGPPVPAGNPDNPLGKRWLGFKEDSQYGFHGTNSEETIGSYESGGCVRMHNAEVIELFEMVGPGVPASIYP